jgi:hypothetical protein
MWKWYTVHILGLRLQKGHGLGGKDRKRAKEKLLGGNNDPNDTDTDQLRNVHYHWKAQ